MSFFTDKEGGQHEVDLSPEMYKAAADAGLTLRQYINTQYPSAADAEVDTFSQMCASEGLFFNPDKNAGVATVPLKQVLNPTPKFDAAGGVVRETSPVQSRVLFPAAILEYVESKLKVDRQSQVNAFSSLLAMDFSVANSRFDQPVVDYTRTGGPEDSPSQQIGQLALPANMLSIVASERQWKIPTESIGLTISNEALESTSLDLVGMALTRQAEIQDAAKADEWLLEALNGNADDQYNAALSTTNADVFDSSISADGELTQLAWVKYLYENINTRRIDTIVCNLDTALIIESRTGKPVITGDDPNSDRIDAKFKVTFPQLVTQVNMQINESIPANTIMGMDTRYALARVSNSLADYSAIEDFVLRKGKGFRFDRGSIVYKPFQAEPFSVMTLLNT